MAAVLRALAASLLLSVLFLHLTTAQQLIMNKNAPSPSPQPLDCGGLCGGRCKESSRPNLCKRACGSCCDKCGCVPPGTYGNYEACPCYFHLTTRNQTRKCP